MSKGFITGTNEELIKAYKESRDESYLKELIEANKWLINLLVSPYLTSIPNSELEDLTSESYIPMLRAIEDYDPEQGVAFSTLLKVYVRQHLNRLYNEATRQKRFTGTTPDSLSEKGDTVATCILTDLKTVTAIDLDKYHKSDRAEFNRAYRKGKLSHYQYMSIAYVLVLGYTQDELAFVMGVDQSVISKNINSGIKRIQRELRAYLEED